MNKVTIDDVAKLAEVSSKTVSRVINREPRVSPATREKIQKVIDELNFQPNKSAQSLAAHRSLLLGLLYDNPSHAYITGLQEGALRACDNFGYGLVIHPCDHKDENLMSKLSKLIGSTRMDGLVLTPPLTENKKLLKFLEENKIPYVLISPLEHEQSNPFVFSDDVLAAKQVTQYLIDQGHSRIGFIQGVRQRSGTEMRFAGYKEALQQNGITYNDNLVEEGNFTFESGEIASQKLLRLKEPPTAIFACNDYMAAGVLKAASNLRISVPYELSIFGFDDSPIASYLTPTLSTVKHPVSLLAENAGELLIRRLKRYEDPYKATEIHSKLVLRESSGPVNVQLKE